MLKIFNKINYKSIFFVVLLGLITYINDIFIRPAYPLYDRPLRDLDHFIAGVIGPKFFFFFLENIPFQTIGYYIGSTAWEFKDYLKYGYFQWDQYLCDLIGNIVLLFIYLKLQSKKQAKTN